ncbi:response regulator [Eubacteriales bacterium OttesenSCG-928-N13]|nr:response regulator [Eubacteriales bacterium OttesenSCG-928-N13]
MSQATNEKFYFSAFDSGFQAGIYVSDARTFDVLYANQLMKDAYPILRDSKAGGLKCYEMFFPGTDSPCENCPHHELLNDSGLTVTHEDYNPWSEEYFRVHYSIVDWDDRPAIFHTLIDISEIRRAEASLQKQINQQLVITEISRMFASVMDLDEVIVKSTQKMIEFLELNAVYIMKTNIEDDYFYLSHSSTKPNYTPIVKPSDRLPIERDKPLYQSFLAGKPWILKDFSMVTSAQRDVFDRSSSTAFIGVPIHYENDIWAMLCCTSQLPNYEWAADDIRFLQTICNIFTSGLERRLREKELIERDRLLEEAKLAAENANRSKSEFLSQMSHEIRTPLNAIIGMTTLIKRGDISKTEREQLTQIDISSNLLLGIINDILDMSKIEANKMTLEAKPFSLDELLHTVHDIVSVRAREKQQQFVLDIDPDIPRFLIGDSLRITQIITNLAYNAVKFSNPGSTIRLRTRALAITHNSATLCFDIIDKGIGMTEEQVSRLFSPFEQANKGIARKYGGSGLGLAIVKSLVDLMSGTVSVVSAPGEGSTFSVQLTLLQCGEGALTQNEVVDIADAVDLSGKCILVAEDVEINRQILIALLEPTNVQIECAENGQIAVDMVDKHPGKYDAILMDVQMPVMDGHTAAKTIREGGYTLPIIAMTANVFKEDVDTALAAGMTAHIAKPIDIDLLLHTLVKYIQ